MRVQDVWNGKAAGLIGEVEDEDIYKLKEINFIPTCIIDIGANIGVFTRYARTLFPSAKIISIEPNKENCDWFKYFTKDKNTILIEKALGEGKVWHGLTAANGSGETYFTNNIGYPESGMEVDDRMEASSVQTIMLSEIAEQYVNDDDKLLIKIDCEGQEHVILFNEKEMDVLRTAEYICAEIHFYALTGKEWQEVQDKTHEALKSLETTHKCELDNVNFWATKLQ